MSLTQRGAGELSKCTAKIRRASAAERVKTLRRESMPLTGTLLLAHAVP